MYKLDLVNYVSKGAVGFVAYGLYDNFVDKRDNNFSMSDAGCYALSVVSAEWVADILSNVWDVNGNSVSGMITKPLLTGIIYMYLFNYFIRPDYNTNRDNTNTFIMGALSEVILSYASNPILGLFGYTNV